MYCLRPQIEQSLIFLVGVNLLIFAGAEAVCVHSLPLQKENQEGIDR